MNFSLYLTCLLVLTVFSKKLLYTNFTSRFMNVFVVIYSCFFQCFFFRISSSIFCCLLRSHIWKIYCTFPESVLCILNFWLYLCLCVIWPRARLRLRSWVLCTEHWAMHSMSIYFQFYGEKKIVFLLLHLSLHLDFTDEHLDFISKFVFIRPLLPFS